MIKSKLGAVFIILCAATKTSQLKPAGLDFSSFKSPMSIPGGYPSNPFGEIGGMSPKDSCSPKDMQDMQAAVLEMFDNIPESKFFDLCNQAVSMAETEAKAKGQSLEQYLQGQFDEMEKAGFIDMPGPLLAEADFKKDSSTESKAKPEPKKTTEPAPANGSKPADTVTVHESTSNYGSDSSGNWLVKRSYSIEAKALMTKAKADLDKIAEQKLKLLENIKNVDDSFGNFYKESGDIIGKGLTKSPDKKKQSPSFVIEAFLEQQLKKVADSATALDEKNPESDDDSKTDLGVAVYKIELVANECRKIMDVAKAEIKKLQELEKMLSQRSEQVEKNVKDAQSKMNSISEKILQIDNTYNDVTAQKLYSEVEQTQQAIAIIKQFLDSDEQSNIDAIKSAFETTQKSILQQVKAINEKVTSVLNPWEKTL